MATRTIGTEIVLSGEKQFNDAMKGVNNNLKNLRSEMAVVAAEFDGNADSMEALTKKQSLLRESVEQHRAKVAALNEMYEEQKRKNGENSAAADKYKQQLNQATVALLKEEKALRQSNEALEAAKAAAAAAENAAEDLAEANSDVARTAVRAADKLDDMADQAEKADRDLSGVAQGFGDVAAGAAQAAAAITAVGVGLGVSAVTALVSFGKEAAEAAKAAAEAGETLSETQQAWLVYADNLGALDDAAVNAKRALGSILLPQLSKLSTEGTAYLNAFSQSMEDAAGDTGRQAEVMSEYLVKGAELLMDNLPEYIRVGRDLLGGLKIGFSEMSPELLDLGVDLVFDLLENFVKNAPEMMSAGDVLFEKLKAGLEKRGPDLIFSAAQLIGELIAGLGDNAADLIPVAGELILALVLGFSEALPELAASAGDIIGSLASYLLDPDTLKALLDAALSIGGAVAQAIWDGLVALWNKIADIPGLVEGLNSFAATTGAGPIISIPGHATGLDRVPYDNYLARLHKDEMVLTAAEAARYRNGHGNPTRIANLTINVKTLNEADLNMAWEFINRKLGEDL